jgi:hypothetical protein
VVYGSTKRQVQAKLKTAQDARDKGIVTTGGNMTVSTWLDQWLDGLDATPETQTSDGSDVDPGTTNPAAPALATSNCQ